MTVPTIGRSVIVLGASANGTAESPGVITRTFMHRDTRTGPVEVNVTVFPDLAPPIQRGYVKLFDTEAQAREFCGGKSSPIAAFWPAHLPAHA